MIGHLAYLAALNAPEIGGALVDSLAKKLASSFVDELSSRVRIGGTGVVGSLLKWNTGSSPKGAAHDSAMPALHLRIRSAIVDAIAESGVAVISVEELKLLYQIVDAADGNGDLKQALLTWKARYPLK